MTRENAMQVRQRGSLSLVWVAIASALLAGLAMAALFSMRYERNLFAEGWAKAAGALPAAPTLETARQAVGAAPAAGAPGALRKCVIKGQTVISNVDCTPDNKTSKVIEIHVTHGIEAPKAPPRADPAPSSDPMIDKMVEKQLH
jgi:hypothetical protein